MTFIYSSPFKLNIGVYDFPHKLISLVNPYIYFTVLRDDCVVHNATTYPGSENFKHNPLLLVTLRAVLETREIRLALVFRYNLKGIFAGQVNNPNIQHSKKFICSTLYRKVFFIQDMRNVFKAFFKEARNELFLSLENQPSLSFLSNINRYVWWQTSI